MSIQFACNNEVAATHDFGRPSCPRCGSVLLVAEHPRSISRAASATLWSCDDCAHEFVTSIRLWPLAA